MTVFDLLFILLFFAAIGTLIAALISAVRGRGSRAFAILLRLAICSVVYIAIVYLVTAVRKPIVLRTGDPQCNDDWCLAVGHVAQIPAGAHTRYKVTLRIFSRARRVAQRENGAKDVYMVDANWKRYDPVFTGSEIPLNTLLQPDNSVTASRIFELPANSHNVGLLVDRSSILPFCVIIGECGAFHKGIIVRLN